LISIRRKKVIYEESETDWMGEIKWFNLMDKILAMLFD
jgi:hypothetical protein